MAGKRRRLGASRTAEGERGSRLTRDPQILHVTNGDVVAERLERSLTGPVLPWRDVLHDGPVPGQISLDELRRVRARFIAACGWARFDDVLLDFAARDAALAAAEEVVLWFERDLYDQLQLVQVLAQMPAAGSSSLVDLEEPGGRHLPGLDQARPVTTAQRRLARRAWSAFRAADPREVEALARERSRHLPFLTAALTRLLEELPAAEDGLARTERQALKAVEQGARTRDDAFLAQAAMEELPFLADASFWVRLERLSSGRVPLLQERHGTVSLTAAGWRVLAGSADHVQLNGVDRWLGGTHLRGQPAWRWSRRERRVVGGGGAG